MSHTRHSIIVYHKNACPFHFLPQKSKKAPSFEGAYALSRVYEHQRFLVSGVRCQIRSLYSRIVRSEENTPLLATLMISLRVHFF